MNDSTHAPSLLLTWRDVLDRIRASSHQTPWSSCEADPFGLRVYCDDEGATRSALEVILGAAFDPIEDKVSLVSSEALVRALPVLILPAAERPPERVHVQRPLWSAGALKVQPASKSPSTALAAFFSFKGGVGRTTSAFATLIALLDRERPKRVLYIDADVEAPGLTWMMGPEERLSWVDALALIHESDDWQRDVLPLIAERAQRPAVDLELPAGRRSFYFMPAVRHIEQVEQIPVTPEQVVRRRDRAWVIGDLLAALGERLGLDAILIDLRAGITEFSSPLLLDPRVRNVLVTSCAEQAIKGTERALHLVEARTSWTASTEVIITQVPPKGEETFQEVERRLLNAWADVGQPQESDEEPPPPMHRVDFSEALLVFDDAQAFARRLPGSSLAAVARSIAEGLVPIVEAQPPSAPQAAATAKRLFELAKRLEFAESNAELGLLPTPPLLHLASQPAGQLPVAVVLGSKGAGKTFTWGQLVVAQSWGEFLKALGTLSEATVDAAVFPLLFPLHLDPQLRQRAIQAEALGRLGSDDAWDARRLAGALESGDLGEEEAVSFWTRAILRRLGLPVGDNPSLRAIEAALEAQGRRVVLVVDGIEDALQTGPDRPMSIGQQRILRSLLTDVVTQLRDLGARHLGLIAFVRRDLANAAIPQNFGQFEARHKQVALNWSPEDALRLALWLLDKAGWSLMDAEAVAQAPYEALSKKLHAFWGEKMGGGKEAYTDRWVIAALSDLNGRFQARDLVRLIHFASRDTRSFPIQPAAIRRAVEACSVEKIKELETEVQQLRPIFKKLREVDSERRAIPIAKVDLGLQDNEIDFLDEQGILFYDEREETFYMPEVIRHGLGFTLGRRGRARVLSLLRAATRNRR